MDTPLFHVGHNETLIMPSDSPTSLPTLPKRDPNSHKGDYGRALLVGGSRGMAGAVALAGMATLRGGAGLVTLAVPEQIVSTVAAINPCYMTIGLASDPAGHIAGGAREVIENAAEPATAIGLGPGLGRSPALTKLVAKLYAKLPGPMVVDADALNALADELARHWGVVLVLKGHRTLITDGQRHVENTTGNPGMATGGSGDVLTGLIVALLCQGLTSFEAAQLGVYLHGLAGDMATAKLGEVSVIASDLIRFLPSALMRVMSP
jgi:ADP-dependent NAD(P)H-hydrate dehydratase